MRRNNQNNLLNNYKKHISNNVPYNDNPILGNSKIYQDNVRNTNFFNKINTNKQEKIEKLKSDLVSGKYNDKLSEYIICPIKIEKSSSNNIENIVNELEKTYLKKITDVSLRQTRNNKISDDNEEPSKYWKENIPDTVKDMWKSRSNSVYKSILKLDNQNKEYKSAKDLIVYRFSQLDKSVDKLTEQYNELTKLIEMHNNELKIIYSASKKNEFYREFEYNNKIKNRIKYDPKNYEDFKDFYKRAQKKLDKQYKRIDDMVNMLLLTNDLTSEEIDEINKIKNETDNEIIDNTDHLEDIIDIEIEKELEIQEQLQENENKKTKKKIEITTIKDVKKKKIEITSVNINKDKINIIENYNNRKKKDY